MGVHGLTTFINENSRRYLSSYKLHNSHVVIDGNSLAATIYGWVVNSNAAFGGDYDKYANYIEEFFLLLRKCNVVPIVIFDGGYEKKKLPTVKHRCQSRVKSLKYVFPGSKSNNTFPLMMRDVFRSTITKMGVSFAQSDFEADDETAAVARKLSCPVLAYDSDYFIYDVLYIPLPTVVRDLCKFNSSDDQLSYYIPCKIYRVENFLSNHGGLEKNMLPLMATLLGNDYIKRSIFNKFYEQLAVPKGRKSSVTARRVSGLVDWLQQETFDSAITKVLGRLAGKKRKFAILQIRRAVKGYINLSTTIDHYICLDNVMSLVNCKPTEALDILDSLIEVLETDVDDTASETGVSGDELSDVEDEDSLSDTEANENDSATDDLEVTEDKDDVIKDEVDIIKEEGLSSISFGIPEWLIDNARKGRVHSTVIDILTLKCYICNPQVEDYAKPQAQEFCLSILRVIVGLLLGEQTIVYWARYGNRFQKNILYPLLSTSTVKEFPKLEYIPQTHISLREAIFYDTLQMPAGFNLNCFPVSWRLFVVTLVFWAKNTISPSISSAHLHAVISCLIVVSVMTKQIGYIRKISEFNRKYGSRKRKTIRSRLKTACCVVDGSSNSSKQHTFTNDHKVMNVVEILSLVSKDDCILLFESLFPYYHINAKLKGYNKLFSPANVHAFAQFQSCLNLSQILNSLLLYPLEPCDVATSYNGTLIYNLFMNYKKRSDIVSYIGILFGSAPTFVNLYKAILSNLQPFLPSLIMKRPRNKTKKNNLDVQKSIASEVKETATEPVDCNAKHFYDPDNPFTLLNCDTLYG